MLLARQRSLLIPSLYSQMSASHPWPSRCFPPPHTSTLRQPPPSEIRQNLKLSSVAASFRQIHCFGRFHLNSVRSLPLGCNLAAAEEERRVFPFVLRRPCLNIDGDWECWCLVVVVVGEVGRGQGLQSLGALGGEAGNCKYWRCAGQRPPLQTTLARPVIFQWRCRAVGDGV